MSTAFRNSIDDAPSAFDGLHQQYLDLRANAECWRTVPVSDQETADLAEAARKQVMALGKAMDTARKAEKQPHDDAGKAVQTKWSPTIEALDRLKVFFGDKVAAYLLAEKRRIAVEKERKREELEIAQRALDDAAENAARETASFADIDGAKAAHSQFLAAGYALEASEAKTVAAGSGAPGVRRVATMRQVEEIRITSLPSALAALIDAEADMTSVGEAVISAVRACRARSKREDRPPPEMAGVTITVREVLV